MKHGTRSMYVHRACRCDDCRRANAEYMRPLSRRIIAERAAVRRFVESRGTGGRNYVDGITHGRTGYCTYSCRCEVCTTACTEGSRRYRERISRPMPIGLAARHGTYARYANKRLPCRCVPCVAAKAEYVRQQRADARARLAAGIRVVDGIKHGYSDYQNHCCRCDVCRAAKAEYDARRWAS